jgi:hypothetical protein
LVIFVKHKKDKIKERSMFTSSLINMAILAYFSVSSGHGAGIDLHAGHKAAAKVEEKVVLRENSLSEKLGLETVMRPDAEVVALQSSASSLKSALSLGEQIKKQTPERPPIAGQWKDKFVVTWDDAGGYYLDRTYHPAPVFDPAPDFIFAGHIGGFNH